MWKSRSVGIWVSVSALCAGLVAMPLAGQTPAEATVAVMPPTSPGEALRIRVEGRNAMEWVTFFYRVPGAADFTSVPLRRETSEVFAMDLDAALVAAGSVDYYLAVKNGAGIRYLPGGAPAALESFTMPASQTPSPSDGKPSATSGAKYSLPFHVQGSLEQTLYHQEEVPGEQKHTASGQVQLGFLRETAEDRLSMDARIAYADPSYGTQNTAYLAGLQADYTCGSHKVRAGDLTIQESEFTVAGAGRRGSDYIYDDQKLYVHTFAVGTQQLAGLDGAAWPHSDTHLYGGALGYKFLEGRWNWKVVFLDGRDNPAQALNGGSDPALKTREGSTVALVQEASLFENRLNLSGEYARSRVDQDVSDSQGPFTDQAWRVAGVYSQDWLTGRLSYRRLGKRFDTLGQTGFVGDRIGIDGAVSMTFKDWSLNATAVDERNNPGGSSLEPKAVNQTQTLEERWSFSQLASARFGLSRGHQESGAAANPLIPFSDSDRLGGFLGLDLVFGPSATLSATYQRDTLESSGGATGRSETELLSGSFGLGPRFHISPSLSWSQTESDPGSQVTRVFSAFLTSDTILIPDTLTFALTGGYSRTALPAGPALKTTTGDAALQFMLNRFLSKGSCVFGLRGRYTRQDNPGQPVLTDNSVALTLNFSI